MGVDGIALTLWGACGALITAALVMAGLFLAGAPGFGSLQRAAAATSATVKLTIVTNAGPHHNWPAFEPSSFSIPTGTPVRVTVVNQDGATPLPGSLSQDAKVTGVVGGVETVTPLGAGRHSTAKDEASVRLTDVSHTFTLPSLKINVPIPAQSRVTFTVEIAKPGEYSWSCVDPCGAGTTGWGPPMDVAGYMNGTVTATGA
ncbi:MAG: hypothetical protein ACREN7_00735 [Candidatus Dormibacteria bacterium]